MHYRIFETAQGWMALGWTEIGISRAILPGDTAQQLRQRLHGSEDADGHEDLVERIVAYFGGTPDGFEEVALDLTGVPDFNLRCYAELRQLGWGETTTYGAIARTLGDVNLSRAVGAAMGANPIPLIVPCHRVLGSNGRSGGFSASGGAGSKMRMLALEQAASPEGQFSFGF